MRSLQHTYSRAVALQQPTFRILLRGLGLLLLLGGMLAVAGGRADAQSNQECLAEVRRFYKKMGDPPPQGKVYSMSYTVDVRAKRAGKSRNISSKVRLLLSRDRMHMMTDEMEVYQDARQVFTIIPASRALYIHEGAADSGRDMRKKMVGALQDSLFAGCTVTKCTNMKGSDGREKRRFVLQMHEKVRKVHAVSAVTIVADVKRESIDMVEYNFVPGMEQEWMKVEVSDVDYDYRADAFGMPLYSMFFDARGSLTPKYRAYTVMDNRRKGTR